MFKKMKTLVILLADYRSKHIFDKAFDGKSAFDLCLDWGKSIPDSKTVIFHYAKQKLDFYEGEKVPLENFNLSSLFQKASELCASQGFEKIVFSFADLPFINSNLTERLLETHVKYKAEYTFFDGYPYGFTPEILDAGTVNILSSLCESTYKEEGLKEITRTSIFDFIKLDINSFEVEVEVCEEDLGLLRLYFDAAGKLNFLSCLALYKQIKGKSVSSLTEDEIISLVKNTASVYKTVPSYYNIQISSKTNYKSILEPELSDDEDSASDEKFMSLENYSEILKKISDFSEEAVINLNFFGEPFLHPDFLAIAEKTLSYPAFTLLIETDGLNLNEEILMKLKALSDGEKSENSFVSGRIIWIVRLDAFSREMYKNLHGGCDGFETAVKAVKLINQFFPSFVYPQFVRNIKNEDELENFWRYWTEKENGSSGNVLIQKYSSFCKKLPDLKSADLSPLERNACYHLRRDFNIFMDGSVPFCHETLKSRILGNVFESSLEKIFGSADEEFSSHLKNSYCEACGNCDEYYTFNF